MRLFIGKVHCESEPGWAGHEGMTDERDIHTKSAYGK
jgi:hypothetical protein